MLALIQIFQFQDKNLHRIEETFESNIKLALCKVKLNSANIDILVILDWLFGRGSWSEHRDQLLGVNNALKDTKMHM